MRIGIAIAVTLVMSVFVVPASAQNAVSIPHLDMWSTEARPLEFCSIPIEYAAHLTGTEKESWMQLDLDMVFYTAEEKLTIQLLPNQHLWVFDPTGAKTQFLTYPAVHTGRSFHLSCEPQPGFFWEEPPRQEECMDTIEEIAAFTHTDLSEWHMMDRSELDPPTPGFEFYSSGKLSDYPMVDVSIDVIPQGVFVSRRAVGAWDYEPFDGADTSLTPGYRNVEAEIGSILVIC